MSKFGKDITVLFLGNAYYDSRTINLMESFSKDNIDYRMISFDWSGDSVASTNDRIEVIPLDRSSSLKFYGKFLFSLFLRLLTNHSAILLAEDVYTLPLAAFFAKIKRSKLLYNSRELYGFLAGLREKARTQKIIAGIEKRFIGYVDLVLTTGEMDSEFIEEYYNLSGSLVLRNLPRYSQNIKPYDLRSELKIPADKKILIYQGVVLEGRGIKKIIEMLAEFDNLVFVILGDGAFKQKFEDFSKELLLDDRVYFYGRVPHNKLLEYSAGADFGVAIIENISKSYYYALPNKLFEYIMAGLPVISSNLPQMNNIVEKYNTGFIVDPDLRASIYEVFEKINNDEIDLELYKSNCTEAAKELNWDNEYRKLAEVLKQYLGRKDVQK